MRRLMWLTLGFGTACGLGVWWIPGAQMKWMLAACIVLTLLGILLSVRYRTFRPAMLLFLGAALGFGWFGLFSARTLEPVTGLDGETVSCRIRTSDYSYETGFGIAVEGVMEWEGKRYSVRSYLDAGEPIVPGTELTGSFRFRLTLPDEEEDNAYYPGKGIFLLAYQTDEVSRRACADADFREWASRIRRKMEEILETSFPQDTVPFAKALLLGNTTELSYETDTDLKLSGIRHVVAVSGMHVSILFALLSAVTFRKRYGMAVLGFPMLLMFAAVAGFTPSVTRACIMSALMLLALLVNKDYDRLTALSFAALVMLVGNPMVITSVSFQLSVASVLGICLFDAKIRLWVVSLLNHPKEQGRRKTLAYWVSSSISITISASILTTPLCAYHFGMVSLVSVVTNLLTLWVISFVFYGLIAVCLLGLFWNTGAALLGWLIAWPIRYVLGVSGLLAQFPLAAVYTRSVYIVFWLVFVYVLLAVFLLQKDKKPGVLLCCGTIGLCLSLVVSWIEPMAEDMRLTVLDVGQGQSLLLQSQGKTFLVDCGGDSEGKSADIAAETLLAQGISQLDGLILTHLDEDHAGGAQNLLTRVPAELLILPPEYTEFSQNAPRAVYADRELEICWEDTVLRIFPAEYPGTGNEKSLCILFDTEKCDILITGDRTGFGERMLLRYHEIPDVDVLIAGHHGADSSTSEELLAAVQPETVCISVGKDNFYGHPSPKLLQRLAAHGCTVYRTDENGTIILRR